MNKTEDDELEADELTETELKQVAGTVISNRLLNHVCHIIYHLIHR